MCAGVGLKRSQHSYSLDVTVLTDTGRSPVPFLPSFEERKKTWPDVKKCRDAGVKNHSLKERLESPVKTSINLCVEELGCNAMLQTVARLAIPQRQRKRQTVDSVYQVRSVYGFAS